MSGTIGRRNLGGREPLTEEGKRQVYGVRLQLMLLREMLKESEYIGTCSLK